MVKVRPEGAVGNIVIFLIRKQRVAQEEPCERKEEISQDCFPLCSMFGTRETTTLSDLFLTVTTYVKKDDDRYLR